MLQEEKDNIAQLLADSGYHLCAFSKDSVYNPAKGSRYFMKMDNGSYLAVISWGDTTKLPEVNRTRLLCRFKNARILTGEDSLVYSNDQEVSPYDFYYGASSSEFISSSSGYMNTSASCQALQDPLEFLGDGAKIKIIIPAKVSFTDFQSSVKTIYFPYFTYKYYQR